MSTFRNMASVSFSYDIFSLNYIIHNFMSARLRFMFAL